MVLEQRETALDSSTHISQVLSILTYLLTYLLTPWSRVLLEKLN